MTIKQFLIACSGNTPVSLIQIITSIRLDGSVESMLALLSQDTLDTKVEQLCVSAPASIQIYF